MGGPMSGLLGQVVPMVDKRIAADKSSQLRGHRSMVTARQLGIDISLVCVNDELGESGRAGVVVSVLPRRLPGCATAQ
jgi:hypothetical protein